VTVAFDNGATRNYDLNTEVDQLRIAYASTVHKTQGAEMPTAIVVIHHSMKRMLCREALYTAITRASQRVIILYTPHGMRLAIARQRIPGANLEEKIKHYQEYIGNGDETGIEALKLVDVRLGYDDFGRQV
jgi:exodeoxyribonuclease V alpha subunit